jgi:hypothetical protein
VERFKRPMQTLDNGREIFYIDPGTLPWTLNSC